jgi:Ca2+-transporting ATPase
MDDEKGESMVQAFYKQSIEQLFQHLNTSKQGLSSQEAQKRLLEYGVNELEKKKQTSIVLIFFRQFLNHLVLILIFAVLVKLHFGHFVDSGVLGGTILFMALVGFIQEIKAEKAIQALKKLSSHKSKVLRDHRIQVIESCHLVPGDVIFLEMGDKIPADARVIESKNLKVDESMITGESEACEKNTEALALDCALAEQTNSVFAGTVVSFGKAVAVVTTTGMHTEIGRIAESLSTIKVEKTPLQKNIESIGVNMIFIILAIVGLFVCVSYFKGFTLEEIFFLSVSAAVSAIPESLPAAFTITLASGMYRMAKKNAIIRKLNAVETLGATTVICSDKTGTLTLNQMTAVKLATIDGYVDFNSEELLKSDPRYYTMLVSAALCNDAFYSKEQDKQVTLGDPTEVALIHASELMLLNKTELESSYQRVKEIPFTSENCFMATLNQHESGYRIHVKGAPEKVLALCGSVAEASQIATLSEEIREKLHKMIQDLSAQALRLIAIASYPITKAPECFDEAYLQGKLIFAGLIALKDPPRPEVKEAIAQCYKAGVKVVMITGDNPATAAAIAKEIGIKHTLTLTGHDLRALNDEKLKEKIQDVSIFARIEPMQKLRIVQALKAHDQIIAMTGDGINDAPALDEANIGVAMGLKGTDVAREVSDMILVDDRFDSIVAAIEEGRAVFYRLRNITAFLLATCFGELFGLILNVITIGLAPLNPIQILWINLVTGGLMAIPLGFETKSGQEMQIPPRDPSSRLLFQGMAQRIVYIALLLGLGSFFMFYHSLKSGSMLYARSMVLTSIVSFEWIMAMHFRSDELTLFKIGVFKNKWLLLAIMVALSLHLSIMYIPYLAPFFHLTALSLQDWAIALIPAGSIFLIESLRKQLLPRLFSSKNGFVTPN